MEANKRFVALVLSLGVGLSLSFSSSASDNERVQQALENMCEKMRQCAVESMQSEDLPKEMLDMMSQQVRMQCVQQINIDDASSQSEAKTEQGIQCLQEMAAMPCGELTMGAQPKSCEGMIASN